MQFDSVAGAAPDARPGDSAEFTLRFVDGLQFRAYGVCVSGEELLEPLLEGATRAWARSVHPVGLSAGGTWAPELGVRFGAPDRQPRQPSYTFLEREYPFPSRFETTPNQQAMVGSRPAAERTTS